MENPIQMDDEWGTPPLLENLHMAMGQKNDMPKHLLDENGYILY